MPVNDPLPPELLAHVARLFHVLGDESRLAILHILMSGPMTVTQVVQASGKGQANVSKHLGIMADAGILARTRKGTQAIYAVKDQLVFKLCDLVCGSIRRRLDEQVKRLSGTTTNNKRQTPGAMRLQGFAPGTAGNS